MLHSVGDVTISGSPRINACQRRPRDHVTEVKGTRFQLAEIQVLPLPGLFTVM